MPQLTASISTVATGAQKGEPPLGSVEKALVVLTTVMAEGRPLRLAELARRTGLAKPTVHRLLAILSGYEMLERSADGYLPGHRLSDVVDSALGQYLDLLGRLGTPHLVDLHVATGAAVGIGVLRCCEVQYVDRVFGHLSARAPAHDGNRTPAHRTAIGRVLLADRLPTHDPLVGHRGDAPRDAVTAGAAAQLAAELREVRRAGIAQHGPDDGVSCMAVLVSPGRGCRPPVAMSMTYRPGRLDAAAAAVSLRRVANALAGEVRRSVARPAPWAA